MSAVPSEIPQLHPLPSEQTMKLDFMLVIPSFYYNSLSYMHVSLNSLYLHFINLELCKSIFYVLFYHLLFLLLTFYFWELPISIHEDFHCYIDFYYRYIRTYLLPVIVVYCCCKQCLCKYSWICHLSIYRIS